MSDLRLPWGASRSVPEGVTTAWGARFIFPDDLLFDRQGFAGPDTEPLMQWLNGGALQDARNMARELARGVGTLRPDEDRTVTLHEDERGIIVGNPQASHGYLYVAAWLKPAA
jgi:hypothetical protein